MSLFTFDFNSMFINLVETIMKEGFLKDEPYYVDGDYFHYGSMRVYNLPLNPAAIHGFFVLAKFEGYLVRGALPTIGTVFEDTQRVNVVIF